jgi:hypothetical protein
MADTPVEVTGVVPSAEYFASGFSAGHGDPAFGISFFQRKRLSRVRDQPVARCTDAASVFCMGVCQGDAATLMVHASQRHPGGLAHSIHAHPESR